MLVIERQKHHMGVNCLTLKLQGEAQLRKREYSEHREQTFCLALLQYTVNPDK